jgi:hypothetical protein
MTHPCVVAAVLAVAAENGLLLWLWRKKVKALAAQLESHVNLSEVAVRRTLDALAKELRQIF